jgi:hypothetical protein
MVTLLQGVNILESVDFVRVNKKIHKHNNFGHLHTLHMPNCSVLSSQSGTQLDSHIVDAFGAFGINISND